MCKGFSIVSFQRRAQNGEERESYVVNGRRGGRREGEVL